MQYRGFGDWYVMNDDDKIVGEVKQWGTTYTPLVFPDEEVTGIFLSPCATVDQAAAAIIAWTPDE